MNAFNVKVIKSSNSHYNTPKSDIWIDPLITNLQILEWQNLRNSCNYENNSNLILLDINFYPQVELTLQPKKPTWFYWQPLSREKLIRRLS